MKSHNFILVAVTDTGAKQLDNLKPEDHQKLMTEHMAFAYNLALKSEGLMYVPLNMPVAFDYYEGIEIAGEGYEEVMIEKLFDNLFMENSR